MLFANGRKEPFDRGVARTDGYDSRPTSMTFSKTKHEVIGPKRGRSMVRNRLDVKARGQTTMGWHPSVASFPSYQERKTSRGGRGDVKEDMSHLTGLLLRLLEYAELLRDVYRLELLGE